MIYDCVVTVIQVKFLWFLGTVTFFASIIPITGQLEIVEGGELVCSGRIVKQVLPNQEYCQESPTSPCKTPQIQVYS